jgi:hypothetical protein
MRIQQHTATARRRWRFLAVRAQVHVMLSQTSTPPPALDLHRILNP